MEEEEQKPRRALERLIKEFKEGKKLEEEPREKPRRALEELVREFKEEKLEEELRERFRQRLKLKERYEERLIEEENKLKKNIVEVKSMGEPKRKDGQVYLVSDKTCPSCMEAKLRLKDKIEKGEIIVVEDGPLKSEIESKIVITSVPLIVVYKGGDFTLPLETGIANTICQILDYKAEAVELAEKVRSGGISIEDFFIQLKPKLNEEEKAKVTEAIDFIERYEKKKTRKGSKS